MTTPPLSPDDVPGPARPGFGEALRFWAKLGCINFGGPAGQIALMQHELVDRRGWIDGPRFLHGLNFCMLLPGPEAQQLATYIGWRLHGVAGGLAAGLLFILPGALVLWLLSWLAVEHGDLAWVDALFDGVKPVVVAIIAAAVWRLGTKTLKGWAPVALAAAAFVGLYFLKVPFPVIVLGAGVLGWLAARAGLHLFAPAGHGGGAEGEVAETKPPKGLGHLAKLALLFLVLLVVPVGAVLALFGTEPWQAVATLFTKAAFVTFGGAYAVLPYIAERGVALGWLTPADMVNGLALAESTPGPLILVTQYVGFFAGWNNPGGLSPFWAGTLGSALTLYVTFLPCFFFIFAGAPYVERLIHNRAASGALAAITAAVVGVILNLGVFLGIHVLMPQPGVLDWFAVVLALAGLVALVRFKVAVHWLVLAGALVGLGWAAVRGVL
ncbi:chromate efflux transporter [Aerophototrophica crusticola]|uniref:Chromate efflux transporter n=1 Tax=Aerophototrophica crusticola TaxID=1709002 RepID=A0A858R3N8_9PROT|nr:chromate efflux transporter [Rhodospirillaceae bacterium B3]